MNVGSEGSEANLFRQRLSNLGMSQSAFAVRLKQLGDSRSQETILRGVQRMATGEARVSGEMKVLLRLLEDRQSRLRRLAEEVVWMERSDGAVTAEVDKFSIYLQPQSRTRWSISLRHKNGYSPPWPCWESDLTSAKARALLAVEEGHRDLAEIPLDQLTAASA